MKRLVRNLSYANVMSTLALFAALTTGTAVASGVIDGRTIKNHSIPASKLMNNSITSNKIRNGQVRSIDIGNKQITSADVKNGALTTTLLAPTTQRQLASLPEPPATSTTPDGPHVVGQGCKVAPAHVERYTNLVGAVGVWEIGTNPGTPDGSTTNLGSDSAGTYKTYHCVFRRDGSEYQRLMSDAVAVNA